MKKILFIMSHIGSGSNHLVDSLNENPRCVIYQSKNVYDHPESLDLISNFHKLKNFSNAIYGDHILYNQSIINKDFYKYFKFIYIIRNPKDSLNEIHKKFKYTKAGAFNYYRFRLRRMCEVIKITKSFIFFNYEELFDEKNLKLIENYLNLIEPIKLNKKIEQEIKNEFSAKMLQKAENCYEKYLYYLSKLSNKELNKNSI